jgi:SAM-dependent methyltransferase
MEADAGRYWNIYITMFTFTRRHLTAALIQISTRREILKSLQRFLLTSFMIMSNPREQATYSHGHHPVVVADHARRTANDSAGFLLPHIKPTSTILDVGCGPGTITADFAALVPQGHVTALDSVLSVLDQAREYAASRKLTNIDFQQLDANSLPFADNTFDIVFCHQVLQHVAAPIAILAEMRRVAKPNGIIAAREGDYGSFTWYPEPPLLEKWRALYLKVVRANAGEPNAGRYLHVWARQAGFKPDEIDASWTSWRFAGERAELFANSHGGRILKPGFLGTALREGFATEEEVKEISQAWAEWGAQEDAFIAIPSGEILCHKTS